ncbi:hypothetical protein D3C76_897080 [compost metagenome]
MEDVGRDYVGVQRKTDTGQAEAADLFDHYGAVEEVSAHAAVLLRDVRTEHARLAGLVPQPAVDMTVLLPLLVIRHRLLLEELAHTVAKEFVVGAEQGSRDHGITLNDTGVVWGSEATDSRPVPSSTTLDT